MIDTKMRGLDLTNQRFGRLVAVGPLHTTPRGRLWLCLCDCGNYLTLATGNLTSGNSSSCGCYKRDIVTTKNFRHGFRPRRGSSPEFNALWNAERRCINPADKNYHNYGGRGIEYRVDSCESLLKAIGPRPTASHSLDRIDNNGHYEIGNLRWATKLEQVHNSRRYQK